MLPFTGWLSNEVFSKVALAQAGLAKGSLARLPKRFKSVHEENLSTLFLFVAKRYTEQFAFLCAGKEGGPRKRSGDGSNNP